MFFFGIEHEVAFLNKEGKFADFSHTKFADFNQIIEKLPTYPSDYPQLRVGDAGIKMKRWYIEGFERFADSDEVIDCHVKGIEIRTTIHSDIQGAITELSESFHLLREVAASFDLSPVLVSFNPYNPTFEPQPPLNDYEIKQLEAYPDEQTANIHMVSYGPDLNISVADLSTESVIDIGRKFTYYSPYIVPFSYSSPFYNGGLWDGLSVRTFIRTGKRPAALVFVQKEEELINSIPSLTKIARIPAEVGRIEFKACDSCDDFLIYASLLALLKGLVLDNTLLGRATVPDAALHQISAKEGFDNEDIFENATKVLQAAEVALENDPDVHYLMPLKVLLAQRKTRSHELIEMFNRVSSIEEVIRQTYQL
ncbi:glutamate--cysteine ligase [Nostoc sp. UCD121]|uniref:glutamate--cysteine ligase n=1 Tax=unclassified Nostoc TaxID=2593658 RepID=UPI0016238000|nr:MULTISPECIES: glutamate--cysteine ligase [unclassified Nostoc]MBC1220568.1 glutamate--cysteine ligase [Nostoc sp. UCD120]MBC1277983.1 glutamate--cysteine ligase [Nostoc sp. UCD121]MBC1294914.1 glutamate--cysteine ligase [Nostoc sp. UCD122]